MTPPDETRRLALGAGREFAAIRRWIGDGSSPGTSPGVVEGPGDDAAVLEGGWVVSSDLMVEDIHFRRSWIGLDEVGTRAVAAGLSDLAAMAAEPVGILVSVATPFAPGEELDRLQSALRRAAREAGAAILGGDLSRSPGPLVVDIVSLGRTEAPLLRTGGRAGDDLWVTGSLGGAAAAVRSWEDGRVPGAGSRAAFAAPQARVQEALWLREHTVLRAMVDLSDGLAGDAGHLAAGSGVAVVLEAGRIPLHPGAAQDPREGGGLALALHGGEDYELCFAAAPGSVDEEAFRRSHDLSLTRVGRLEEGEGVWLERDGSARERLGAGGYDHLAPEGSG